MRNWKKILAVGIISFVLASCSDPEFKEEAVKNPSGFGKEIPKLDENTINNNPGIAGVYEVSEMLSLCKMDSGSMQEIPAKVISGFATLEKELYEIGAEIDGPQGMIYYTNDPKNFKFETVLLLKDMPKKTPKNCQIVVLEASYMLIYNYYGPYENTFKSYDVIQKYIRDNSMQQVGPTREFYPEIPGSDLDSTKLLTRIMVPVIKIKKEF